MNFYVWLAVFAALVLIGFILDREIYFYEGVHLGPRIQAWLYDRWAKKYDQGKRESQLRDDEILAGPLLGVLKDIPSPFILDFATGTGRLSYALISRPDFKGHIIALDLSQGMLELAAEKLRGLEGTSRPTPLGARIELLRHLALPLPFPDAAFDAVCALEVLELFPNMDEPLAELTRVLRPGGIFLTSRGTEESGRRARVKSRPVFAALLQRYGLMNIQIVPWWKLFDRVFAQKAGTSKPVAERRLSDVLRCQSCRQSQWQEEEDVLKCGNCGKLLSITKEGIVLN